ncbi:Uncharacterised protein [Vibrio cholerae]|nr:Uncharacterised protein [Vibrio cholerae]
MLAIHRRNRDRLLLIKPRFIDFSFQLLRPRTRHRFTLFTLNPPFFDQGFEGRAAHLFIKQSLVR